MSVSTAMYSGLSGLSSFGEAMSVVGDNIANINTTGFKYSAVHFEDLMSQLVSTGSGPGQVGRGGRIEDISMVWQQGSLDTSADDVDVAITGTGFLIVKDVTVFAAPIMIAMFETQFGEGIGLQLILGMSIPVDIWALGLVGRTFFLDRLRREPPHDGLGLAIWWRAALIGTFFLPLLWWVVSRVTEIAITASHSMAEMESMRHLFDTGLPIAERIGLELTLWGSISSAVLIVLAVIGISILGQIIRRMAENSRPTSESYQGLITRWDLMRVPSDQGLLLASLAGVGVVLSLMLWTLLPVTTPHPHDCCKKPEVQVEPIFKPVESLNKNAQRIASVAAQVEAMEQAKAETKGRPMRRARPVRGPPPGPCRAGNPRARERREGEHERGRPPVENELRMIPEQAGPGQRAAA